MKKEFVPRELAIRLKTIGYEEKVFAWSDIYNDFIFYMYPTNENNMNQYEEVISIPTFSQAFRWFREKYELTSEVCVEQYRRKTNKKWMFSITYLNEDAMYEHSKTTFENYEEAELACLDRLIEIVETE